MQVVDNNGNVFGGGLQVNGPDGKPKTSGGGGGTPSGPAGGDLSGTYPNPSVTWANGVPTYNLQYYPLSLNPAGYLTSITSSDVITALGYTPYSNANPSGYITSSALTPYLTSATAASTYYPLTNPSGYITNAALSGYLTAANAASTYYPLTNPNAYISGITGSMVTTALGYTPYNSTNPSGYITSSALSGYLTSATAAATYYPLTNPNSYISGITGSMVTTALGYTPYNSTNPDAYITADALTPYLTITDAEVKYYPVTNPSSYISGITSADVTTALGYIPYSNSNPAGYITSSALGPYLTAAIAATTYFPIPTGTVSQYIRGNGTIATFPTIPTVTPSALTKVDDTNVTLTLGGTPASALLQSVSLTLGWTGTLADSRIASASTWNAKQNAITLTTTGTSGAATLVGSTLNIPNYASTETFIDVQTFTSSGVWTKPTNAKQVEVFLFGAGGGGGSGRRGAALSARYGGGGAATGSVVISKMNASILSATENVWIGIGATGASGTIANDTNGTAGNTGGTSYLGGTGTAATAKIIAPGGVGGAGGTNTANGTGNAASQLVYGVYGVNTYGTGSLNANAFTVINTLSMRPISGGVYGGGIDATNVRNSGASIQNRKMDLATSFYTTSGGVAAGAAGGNGTLSLTDANFPILSSGGAGGAAGDTAGTIAGGRGGDGAMCAGGGGGGASTNGAASGAGGTGGNGYCIIITYF